MPNPVDTEIRALVRELLLEVMPAAVNNGASRDDARSVRIENDADLAAFAVQILDIARDPAAAERIRAGRIRFLLEGRSVAPKPATAAPAPAAAPVSPSASVLRIDTGAVTEKIVARAAASGTRLVLGPRAVLTPLAKEGARKHGVGIERAS